jgi:hypothetical protein
MRASRIKEFKRLRLDREFRYDTSVYLGLSAQDFPPLCMLCSFVNFNMCCYILLNGVLAQVRAGTGAPSLHYKQKVP